MAAYPFLPSPTWREFLKNLKDKGIASTNHHGDEWLLENPKSGDYYVVKISAQTERVMPSVQRSTICGVGLNPEDFGFNLSEWWSHEDGVTQESDDDD